MQPNLILRTVSWIEQQRSVPCRIKKEMYRSTCQADSIIILQEWKMEKKSSDLYLPNNSSNVEDDSFSNSNFDEEAPLMASSRLSHIGRTQLNSHAG